MWVVENFRPFKPTFGQGKQYKVGTKFIWEVADVLHGGRIIFRFTTIDGRSNCLVTMRELDYFVEVSDDVVNKSMEDFQNHHNKMNGIR